MSLREANVYHFFRTWWYLGLLTSPSDWLAIGKFVAKRTWTYKTYKRRQALAARLGIPLTKL